MSTDKRVIEFFRDVLKLNEIKSDGSSLKLKTVKEFREDEWLIEDLKDLEDDDLVLLLEANSESYDFLSEVMDAMGFKSLNY